MIGVDIIDRSCSFQSNRKHRFTAYLAKIINSCELDFCDTWQDLDMIWAIKESSYKCYFKKYRKPFFNPKRVRITEINLAKCNFRVEIDECYFTGCFKITGKFIYAIASDSDDFAENVELFLLDQYSSSVQIQSEFAKKMEFKYNHLGFPESVQISEAIYAYSRSHHGRYYFSAISSIPYN